MVGWNWRRRERKHENCPYQLSLAVAQARAVSVCGKEVATGIGGTQHLGPVVLAVRTHEKSERGAQRQASKIRLSTGP